MVEPLRIDHHVRGECIIVEPVGLLGAASYARLRDVLLKLASDLPVALIVDLHGLQVEDPTVLSVFPAVTMGTMSPPVPLLLAVGVGRLGELLGRSPIPRFVPTYPTVPAALHASAARPWRRRRQLDLPCDVVAPRLARGWIREVCADWGLSAREAVDAVVLVGSELVENVVQHAGTPGRLRLDQHRAGLTVAVADGSDRPPVQRAAGGLAVVDVLAVVWGHTPRHPAGKVVWSVLPFPEERRRAPAVPRRVPSLPLRTALALTDLRTGDLWLRYMALGGHLSQAELDAVLHGGDLTRAEYVVVAQAFDEYFADRGSSYSVEAAPE